MLLLFFLLMFALAVLLIVGLLLLKGAVDKAKKRVAALFAQQAAAFGASHTYYGSSQGLLLNRQRRELAVIGNIARPEAMQVFGLDRFFGFSVHHSVEEFTHPPGSPHANPIAGAVIGNMVAGSVGAIVGAAAGMSVQDDSESNGSEKIHHYILALHLPERSQPLCIDFGEKKAEAEHWRLLLQSIKDTPAA